MTRNIPIWSLFALTSVLTPVVYKTAYALSAYSVVLSCLGIAAIVFAGLALRHTGLKAWSVAVVAGGLVIGQWWFIQIIVLQAFWNWRGFGP